MLHHIKKLHSHPEHVREKIALGVAAVLTLSILIAWFTTLDTRLALSPDWGVGDNQAAVSASVNGLTVVNERKVEADSPVNILKRKVGETYGDFREAVGY
ncbi:MAG: hypothetical protein HYY60_02765 [Parcubacteria group bacterium]|nr:hypothetical protein [Parcubacteria group bacterium]